MIHGKGFDFLGLEKAKVYFWPLLPRNNLRIIMLVCEENSN